ncbi:MAG: hypothetical protein HRU29_06325 [Rhizobiales bacterium]|nr:hypothetical protein [Hyphomicrobiales bacterium]NRB14002.1 hypothetical protein [Hyphomicrobiales bacterium]
MFRYLLIAGTILVSLMTFQLYEVSYNTNDIRQNIKLLKAEIVDEKQRINNLRAALSRAKQPQNIKQLNLELLQLSAQKIDQFVTIDQLPYKLVTRLPELTTLNGDDQKIYNSMAELAAQFDGDIADEFTGEPTTE